MPKKWKGKKIAVLMGGITKEREISLRTGSAIASALLRLGYDVASIDVCMGTKLIEQIKSARPDVAVIALHGKYGEDGCIQGFLEMMGLPYTGGGVLASSVGMDKVVCKRIAREIGIQCPEEAVIDTAVDDIERKIAGNPLKLPVIVKPSREGSTINMTVVNTADELLPAIKKASESDNKVIIEAYISGKEITVGVLNGKALPCLEIAPKSGFYDYASKYTKGMTEYIIPARIDEKVARKLEDWSERIYAAIECDGIARADYIVTEKGETFFLEINTIPGMMELSLVPKAAAHIGISFDDLCERLLGGARLKIKA